MSTLRFHRGVYTSTALDAAIEVFADHAVLARQEQDAYFVIEIQPHESESAELLAGEFCNYVLALTVEESRAST